MDSLTQIVLGASVAEASLGRKIGNKAILIGAIAGTIPDLDIVLRFFVDELSASELHRGFSHSLIFPFFAAPFFGWLLKKKYLKLKHVSLFDWVKMLFLVLITHSLLDAQTTWGTQLFWPFEWRVATNNVFIIDPLYTIPFLIFLLLTCFQKKSSNKRRRYNSLGLIISSLYLVFTFISKGIGFYKINKALEDQGIEYINLDTKPTPFNSILWAGQIETKNAYRFTYYSLFDKSEVLFSREFPKNHHLLEPYLENKKIQKLIIIANGHYLVRNENDKIIFWNLKIGQIGYNQNSSPFVWSYEITTIGNELIVKPGKSFIKNRNFYKEFGEFYERLKGI